MGYQRKAVDRYLRELSASSSGVSEDPAPFSASPLTTEHLERYRDLGVEIGDLISAVQVTAHKIKEQAEVDAARWRREAGTEAEITGAEAQAAAEQLRASAWDVANELITQIQSMEEEAYRTIERRSQEVVAEAENESHRIRAEARRRGESMRSQANVESLEVEERTRALCDQMIKSAEQRVSAIQERVLALERHRDQLLEEIGGIRSGAPPIGVKLVDQTGALIYGTPDQAAEPGHVTPEHEMSGLVRVISSSEAAAAEAAKPAEPESPPAPASSDDGPQDNQTADPEDPIPSAAAPPGSSSEMEDLFSALRKAPTSTGAPRREKAERQPPAQVPTGMGENAEREEKESLLLPIIGQYLRLFKRLLAEEQNRVLEGLRTGELAWEARDVERRLGSNVEMYLEQCHEAGHGAAERVAGQQVPKAGLDLTSDRGFFRSLVTDVTEAIEGVASSADHSQRSVVASRVFRLWRSEKLERHLQGLGSRYYEDGYRGALKAAGVAGR